MTIQKLAKELEKLIAKGHGRKPVWVNKPTFTNPLEEDGCVLLDVHGLEFGWHHIIDDDGGLAENKDGSEHGQYVLLLYGNDYEPEKGAG